MRPHPLLALAVFAASAGWICGFDVGAMAFALKQWPACLGADEATIGAILAAAAGGGLAAALASGWLADAVGRRKTVCLGALALAAGIALVVTAGGWPQVAAGRFLEGAAGSLLAAGATTLLAESAPTRWRGMLTGLFPLLVWVGIMAGTAAAAWMEAQTLARMAAAEGGPHGEAARAVVDGAWRAMFGASLPPAALLLAAGCFVLESPRWMFESGRVPEARALLLRLRPAAEAALVWDEMAALPRTSGAGKAKEGGWAAAWRPGARGPFLRVLALFALHYATGLAAVLYFPTQLLGKAGLPGGMAGPGAVALMGVFLAAAVVNACLIDKVGRQVLLRGGLLLALAGLALATLVYWHLELEGVHGSPADGWRVLACLALYAFGIGVGPAGSLWLLAAELLPARARSAGMAAGLVLLTGVSMASVVVYAPVVRLLGTYAVVVLWLLGTLGYLVFAVKCLPETKGRTLEEIEAGAQADRGLQPATALPAEQAPRTGG